jgi:hypothetical protein
MSARNDIDRLKFPSGLSVRQAKSNAKKLKIKLGIKLHEAQHKVAAENGLDMPWDQAIEALRSKSTLVTGGTLAALKGSDCNESISKVKPPTGFMPDYANIVNLTRSVGDFEYISQQEYPVYPSVFVKIPDKDYYDAAIDVGDNIKVPCIYYDGEVIIVPESYTQVIQYLVERYKGEVIATGQMKQHEFATLAIKQGVQGELVALGDALMFPHDKVSEMLGKAISNPEETLLEWKELYRASMDLHATTQRLLH